MEQVAVNSAIQTSKLLRSEQIAEGTMAFHFEKPGDFQFKAGQAIDITLLNPT
jgi:ferredoxin-NADP reductase